jgi:prepilin-type N-terminal cleavage/methylation domain-containing protein
MVPVGGTGILWVYARFVRSRHEFRDIRIRGERYRSRLEEDGDGGFTLLEIPIVTLLIGILSALAFPAYQRWIDKTHYARAKVQMSCFAKEIQAFKMEDGYFPDDVSRDIPPSGTWNCFYRQSSGQVPFDSKYDHENWAAAGGRYIQITFLGKNGLKEFPANNAMFPEPGFYEYGQDDLVLGPGID